ncbi:MAG TPA: AMP-binding protein [Myxococcaceae bacterium]|nr:AMP-binding protein [Myxococcaceae bacterium]
MRTLPIVRFEARTLPGLLALTARRVPDRVFLRFLPPGVGGPPRDVRFSDFRAQVCRAAAFLERAGVRRGDRVMLLAENSPEWQAVAFGAQLLGAEPSALFASLGGPAVQDIALRVRPHVGFVSTREQWAKLAPVAEALAGQGLTSVLAADSSIGDLFPEGIRCASVDAVLGEGAPGLGLEEFEARAASISEEDPFLLLFTSGTTGRQKGVRLPQRTIVHAIEAGALSTARTERDVGLHLLPFGHVAGHDQFALALAQGHTLLLIAHPSDAPPALALGPTYVFSVPLVYERMRARALEGLGHLPWPLRRLLHAALEAAARVRVDGASGALNRLGTWAADLLVGRKVRTALGGRVEGLFAGGAPTSATLFRFFEGLGIPLVELYGMSETAGMISSNLFGERRRPLSVGLVSPDHELRFAEDHELLLRGPLMLSGYLEPVDDADAWTPDGFFRTGDLGELDADGWLHITGRKKHLLVLSTGKKVAPEPLETALGSTPPFEGALLLGDGCPFVTAAVFVPRSELARLKEEGKNPAEALLPVALEPLGAFSDYEKPKRLLVIPGSPTDYPDLVTPTLKLRRKAVLDFLGPELPVLYSGPRAPG